MIYTNFQQKAHIFNIQTNQTITIQCRWLVVSIIGKFLLTVEAGLRNEMSENQHLHVTILYLHKYRCGHWWHYV